VNKKSLKALTCTETIHRVPLEKYSKKSLGFWRQEGRHAQFGLEDLCHGLFSIATLERQRPSQHLVLKLLKCERVLLLK
jgi:hypothetical protein